MNVSSQSMLNSCMINMFTVFGELYEFVEIGLRVQYFWKYVWNLIMSYKQ